MINFNVFSKISLAFLFLLFSSISLAETQPVVAKAEFEQTNFDYGRVAEGTIVSHTFNFKNVGNAGLSIQRVITACGCTAASSSSAVIEAGAQGSIKVDFDTTGFSGNKTKKVSVFSNDYDNPEQVLTLTGSIESEISINPSRLYFEDVVRGKEYPAQEFEIAIKSGSNKRVESVTSYSKVLQLEELGKSNTSARYRVSVLKDAAIGEIRDRILINLLEKDKRTSLSVPVLGKISGPISLEPAQISFGIVDGVKKLERAVRLKNRGEAAFNVTSVSSDHQAVHPEFKIIEPGKTYVITVTIDPKLVTSDLRALIEIKTTSSTDPTLYLSVFGVVPPKLDF